MSYCSAFALFGKLNGLTRQSSRLSRSRRSVRFVPSSCSTRQEVHGDNAACLSSSICIVRISSYRQMGVSEAIEGVQEACIEWRRRQERTQTPRSNRRHLTHAHPIERSAILSRKHGAVVLSHLPVSLTVMCVLSRSYPDRRLDSIRRKDCRGGRCARKEHA